MNGCSRHLEAKVFGISFELRTNVATSLFDRFTQKISKKELLLVLRHMKYLIALRKWIKKKIKEKKTATATSKA